MHSESCPTPGQIGQGVLDILQGATKELPRDSARPGLTLYNRAGFGTNDAEEMARISGVEFEAKMTERGEVFTAVNKAANVEGIGPHQPVTPDQPFLFPSRVDTDSVNPRDLNATERLAYHLTRKNLNLATLLDNGVTRGLRAIEQMTEATLEADFPAIKGETVEDFVRLTQRQLTTMLGIADKNAADLVTFIGRRGAEDQKAIMQAAGRARASMTYAAMLQKASQRKAAEIAKDLARGVSDRVALAELVESRGMVGDFLNYSRIVRAALGKGLRMQAIGFEKIPEMPQRLSSAALRNDMAQVEKILLDAGGVGTVEKLARNLAAIGPEGDMASIAAGLHMARGSTLSRTLAATKEGWVAGLLSSFRTLDVNFAGNMFSTLALPFERAAGAKVGMMLARTPERVAEFQRVGAVAMGQYGDMVKSLNESFHYAKVSFRENREIFDPFGSKFENPTQFGRRQALHSRNFDIVQDGVGAKSINAVGAMSALVLKTLRATDGGYKQLTARSYARSFLREKLLAEGKVPLNQIEAKVEAGLDKILLDGQVASVNALRDRFIDDARRNGQDGLHAIEAGERNLGKYLESDEWAEFSPIANQATANAKEATFQTPQPDHSIGRWIQNLTVQHPALGFIAPFVNTPLNLLKFAGQRVDVISLARWVNANRTGGPGAVAFKETKMRLLQDLASGDPERKAMAVGRLVTGGVFMSAAATVALQGNLTGRGPSNPAERKALLDSGWLPYSIKVGDTYVSYARLDPVATLIGSVADLVHLTAYLPEDKKGDVTEMMGGLLQAASNNFVNKTYLQGIANFMEVLTGQTPAAKYLTSFGSSFVPNLAKDAAGLVSDLAGEDEALKDVRGVIDAFMAKIPGLSLKLEPARNALGEEVKRTTSLGSSVSPLANLFVPLASSQREDPVTAELAATQYGWQPPPSKRPGYDMLDITDASGRTAYDRFGENLGSMKLGGATLRQSLQQLIDSPRYKAMSPINLSDFNSPRVVALQARISRFRRAAFDKTQREIPALNQAELNARMARAGAR